MYDFHKGAQASQFVRTLKDAFPFFRMFLEDSQDAVITMFIHSSVASRYDLDVIEQGLDQAIHKITLRYPKALMPGAILQGDYEHELVMLQGVSRILQLLIHLHSVVTSFQKVVHFGGNPANL
jgi:hypothetical protein